MNQLDALTTILDATVELDERPHLKRARKVLARMAEARRAKRERRFASPEAWPTGQHDCPKCGTPGSSRGATTNRQRWVQVMKCPSCGLSWDRIQEPGQLTVLAYKCEVKP